MSFELFSLILYWICTVGGLLVVATGCLLVIGTLIVNQRAFRDHILFNIFCNDAHAYRRLHRWVLWKIEDEEVRKEFTEIFRKKGKGDHNE